MKGRAENKPHSRMGEKNRAPFGHTHGTHAEIEEHMRKHRAKGGAVESDMSGDDEAEEDLKRKNMEYTKDSNVNREAEETKARRGGKMKRKSGGKVDGKEAHKHSGRKARASGGACEEHPFTTANKGTPARGRRVERETMGRD